ncbi:MAG: alpha-isopropylmalate synthase regulatory domain-containing protein [Candidatus Caldatribacteriota bacterium]|nr:alpha-isopropylmalate synthase regulatory domain-containing protein [Candidatus Caldatribacteriota bacterium]
MTKKIEIMDTTLRDGEQMKGVSYSPPEKLAIAKILLDEVKVDRIEVASARVSKGEEKSVTEIVNWAKKINHLEKIEVLGFIDKTKSVDWIYNCGGKVMNILAKGSINHLTKQLRKTKEQHVQDIKETVKYANKKGIICNIYFEDWSQGMINSREYVYYLIDNLKKESIKRFMLPDTLGILSMNQVSKFIKDILKRYPDLHFDFHAHNDYGLAMANTLVAVEAGIKGVHCTVNGMGERTGNAPLDEVVVGFHDFLKVKTGVEEKHLFHLSKTVEVFSGQRIAFNKPICGTNVFTQTAGIHADGDKKGNLYVTSLFPERFDRKRQYSLGKLSGKSNLEYNLEEIDIKLTKEQKKDILDRVIDLGDKKETITVGDLPYIISDVLEAPQEKTFKLKSCNIVTSMELKPIAVVKLLYKDKEKNKEMQLEESAQGDGGYDAFMNAIRKISKKINYSLPALLDYTVNIPPGGKTDALVRCTITWGWKNHKTFITKGINCDQVLAAVEATEKMLNIIAFQTSKIEQVFDEE